MQLKAELREKTGTSASRHARREGLIPVTVFGHDVEATSLLIARRDFEALVKAEGTNAVFDLSFDGKLQKVWLKNYDRGALKDEIYSIELEAVSANQVLSVEVPLHLVGDDTVEEGIVELVLNTITVETKPDAIPQSIEVDVTGLSIGDTLTVEDVKTPEGVTKTTDSDAVIVTVSVPTVEEETEADEGAEPEVIGEATSAE